MAAPPNVVAHKPHFHRDDAWKQPVRVATTTAGTLASSFENGDTVDGETLATGDRLLVKDQADATENGIYIVAASGAPTRSFDMDAEAEFPGAVVLVMDGTQAGTLWRCAATTIVLVGTDDVIFEAVGRGDMALDDLTDVTITSPATNATLRYNGSAWVDDSRIWRPLMDGSGNVITDGGSGEAVMALSE